MDSVEMHGTASESDVAVIALEKTGDCAENAMSISHSAHKCCGENSACIILEKINIGNYKRLTAEFVFRDASKASAIVEPALEPPTA